MHANESLKTPAVSLYLDLLRRSLTNTLLQVEPDTSQEDDLHFVHGFIQHYMKGSAVTMLPLARLENIQDCVFNAIADGVPGDLIEAGVWRGGATIFMRGILKALGIRNRVVWVADSFEGLPEPDAEKYPIEAKTYHGPVIKKACKRFAAGLEEVQHNFEGYGLLDEQVCFLKGWFKDTLPAAPIVQLAVMRLDGDYYESTMDGLNNLYDKLSVGGFAIIDDYGEDVWTYCRKAVDEFRARKGIRSPMLRVDSKCHYWRREA
jgi:O-methyltransferase